MYSVRLFLFQDDFGVDAFVNFISERWPSAICTIIFRLVKVVGVFTEDDLWLISTLYSKVYKNLTEDQAQEVAALIEIHSLTSRDL